MKIMIEIPDLFSRVNFLRKLRGKQKEYEDKIKAAKKAEMDAKKAAIRTEDIAKGVYVPVSALPKSEPTVVERIG